MPHPNVRLSPHQKYGSVEDSEQPTTHGSSDSLLTSTSGSSSATYPGTVGEHQCPPQQNKNNVRDPVAGRHVSRRLPVIVTCGLAFLAWSSVSLIRSSNSRTTSAAAGSFFEVGAHTGVPGAQIRPTKTASVVVDDADDATLEFTALNFYHVRDGKPGQDYPWLKGFKLIEPHRDTTLAVVRPREGFDYRWEIRAGGSGSSGGVGDVQATATGAVTIVVLTQLHENVIVLEEVNGDGQVTNRLEETVMVKYVRREIRTLTDDERDELLDAVSEHTKQRKAFCLSYSSEASF